MVLALSFLTLVFGSAIVCVELYDRYKLHEARESRAEWEPEVQVYRNGFKFVNIEHLTSAQARVYLEEQRRVYLEASNEVK